VPPWFVIVSDEAWLTRSALNFTCLYTTDFSEKEKTTTLLNFLTRAFMNAKALPDCQNNSYPRLTLRSKAENRCVDCLKSTKESQVQSGCVASSFVVIRPPQIQAN